MKGEIIPFVAAWLCLVFGLLVVQGALGKLWRNGRFRGRATGADTPSLRRVAAVPVATTAPLSFRPVVEFSLDGRKYTRSRCAKRPKKSRTRPDKAP